MIYPFIEKIKSCIMLNSEKSFPKGKLLMK